MNKWVQRSEEVANSPGYLDALHKIYPVMHDDKRILSEDEIEELREIYERQDDEELLWKLLKLPKFPINDPYVAFLRRKEGALRDNPETVKRIASQIRKMGFDNIVKAIQQPKEFNRQMGPLFRKWIEGLGYPLVSPEDLERYEIALLKGGDKILLEFANNKLKCDLGKAPDFIIKVGKRYVIGEAKFLTDYGGHQYAQLKDALALLEQEKGEDVVCVAILDGVVWISKKTKMYRRICELPQCKPVFTALLLQEFISTLK